MRKPSLQWRGHSVCAGSLEEGAWEAGLGGWGCFTRGRGKGKAGRGTAEAEARRLMYRDVGQQWSVRLSGGFLVGQEVRFRGGWKGKSWPQRACLLESVSENKSESGPLLQNQRTQEIIFEKEIQPLG